MDKIIQESNDLHRIVEELDQARERALKVLNEARTALTDALVGGDFHAIGKATVAIRQAQEVLNQALQARQQAKEDLHMKRSDAVYFACKKAGLVVPDYICARRGSSPVLLEDDDS